MRRLAIFRRDPSRASQLFEAAVRSGVMIHDVTHTGRFSPSHCKLADTERQTSLTIDRLPIQRFDNLWYFDLPRVLGITSLAANAQAFAESEWHSYLTSILRFLEIPPLGLSPNPADAAPIGRVRSVPFLSMLGWQTAELCNEVDLDGPPPVQMPMVEDLSVVFTRKRWIPTKRFEVSYESTELNELCWATWEALLAYNEICLTLRLRNGGADLIAADIYSLLPGAPSDDLLTAVVEDALY